MATPKIIGLLLIIDIIVLAFFALFYLAQRRMHWFMYIGWALVAIIIPVLGPFLVISNHPGEWRSDPFPSAVLRQKIQKIWLEVKDRVAFHFQGSNK